MIKVGLDLDGVFADFNTRFAQQLIDGTGKDLRPSTDYQPHVWHWPQALGYTEKQVSAAWRDVDLDPLWWISLGTMSDAHWALFQIGKQVANLKFEAIFLTTRPSPTSHWQSTQWVARHFPGGVFPQVCICANAESKGLIAKGLGLDLFIDDRPENIVAVKRHSPGTRVLLLRQPWNVGSGEQMVEAVGGTVIDSLTQLIETIDILVSGK